MRIKDKIVFRIRAIMAQSFQLPYKMYLRFLGFYIGKNVSLKNVHYTWPHQVSIGDNTIVETSCYFKYDGIWSSGPNIIIGKNIFIGRICRIQYKRSCNRR